MHKDTAREGIAIRVTLGVLGVRTRGSSPSPLTAPRHVIKQRGGAQAAKRVPAAVPGPSRADRVRGFSRSNHHQTSANHHSWRLFALLIRRQLCSSDCAEARPVSNSIACVLTGGRHLRWQVLHSFVPDRRTQLQTHTACANCSNTSRREISIRRSRALVGR